MSRLVVLDEFHVTVTIPARLPDTDVREVRRVLDAIGLKVNRLIRVSYGPFQLGVMEPGAVEEIPPKVLREQLGLKRGE